MAKNKTKLIRKRESKRITTVLECPDYYARKTPGTLGRIYIKLLAELRINYRFWRDCMDRYTSDRQNVPVQTPKKRNEARSNLTAAVMGDNPSWLQFTRGIKALDIKSVKITMEFETSNGRTATVQELINYERLCSETRPTEEELSDGEDLSKFSKP